MAQPCEGSDWGSSCTPRLCTEKVRDKIWQISMEKNIKIDDISTFIVPIVCQDVCMDTIFIENFIMHETLWMIEEHPTEPIASYSSKA